MPTIDLTPIIQAFLALLAALITYRLIPWIRERTTEAQQGNLRAAIRVMVFAAEQIYGAGHGAEKLQYVRDRLDEQGFHVDVDEIEAAVGEFINRGVSIEGTEETEIELGENDELPPLEDWPPETITRFCADNGISCDGCVTKEDYIQAIVKGARQEPIDYAEKPPDLTEAEDEGRFTN